MDTRKLHFSLVCLLIAAVALAIVVMVQNDHEAAQQKDAAAAALAAAQRPYLAELTELNMELAQLDKDYQSITLNVATAHYLFAEPDARILTEAVPLMAPYEYVGMIAVSEAFFPGSEGCLTAAELIQLMDKGWGICISVESAEQLPELYNRIQASGLPVPQAVYFPNGNCDLAAEEIIRSLGISVVIQYGSSRPMDAAGSSLWYLEARGTFDTENYNAFMRAMSDNTGMVLTEGWLLAREIFSQEDFQSNLDFFADYVSSGQISVSSIATAYKLQREAAETRAANEQVWQTRRNELVQRQREIEDILRDLGEQISNP